MPKVSITFEDIIENGEAGIKIVLSSDPPFDKDYEPSDAQLFAMQVSEFISEKYNLSENTEEKKCPFHHEN